MNDIKLKPCPFCGDKASVIETYNHRTKIKGYYIAHQCFWGVEFIRTNSYLRPEDAAKAWNWRAGEKNE